MVAKYLYTASRMQAGVSLTRIAIWFEQVPLIIGT